MQRTSRRRSESPPYLKAAITSWDHGRLAQRPQNSRRREPAMQLLDPLCLGATNRFQR
jgi:hypothetical protein